jgi:hypothetical protein
LAVKDNLSYSICFIYRKKKNGRNICKYFLKIPNCLSDVYDVYYGKMGFSHGFMNLADKDQINDDEIQVSYIL